MSYGKFNKKTYEDAGEACGHLIQNCGKSHNLFWLNLYKKTNPEIFNRIQIFIVFSLSCFMGFIYQHIWTFIFGSITNVSFPFGFIKLVICGTIGYVCGFEFGYNYIVYIDKLVKQSEITTTDLPKELKEYTYDVKEMVPLKKRRNSDTELCKKTL